MSTELMAQIAAVIIAVTALYKAWGGAKKDELDSLMVVIGKLEERLESAEDDVTKSREKINALECENKTLRTENATLHERLNLIRADLSTVQADNLALKRENETLRAEVGALRVEVEEYRTGKRKRPPTGPLE